jgi:hypothetical protein
MVKHLLRPPDALVHLVEVVLCKMAYRRIYAVCSGHLPTVGKRSGELSSAIDQECAIFRVTIETRLVKYASP